MKQPHTVALVVVSWVFSLHSCLAWLYIHFVGRAAGSVVDVLTSIWMELNWIGAIWEAAFVVCGSSPCPLHSTPIADDIEPFVFGNLRRRTRRWQTTRMLIRNSPTDLNVFCKCAQREMKQWKKMASQERNEKNWKKVAGQGNGRWSFHFIHSWIRCKWNEDMRKNFEFFAICANIR